MHEPDFHALKRYTNGMLSAEAYAGIYAAAQKTKKGDVLDIGTAHGAAAITAALGLPQGKVITIDKIKGGSRDQYGDINANVSIILENFAKFGVAGKISFRLGDTQTISPLLPIDLKIGMLIIDADGAIDRDFKLFYDRVLPGAYIIIDDYQPNFVRVYDRGGGRISIDQKRRLTALLAHYFEEKGFVERADVIGETYFGRKPLDNPSIKTIHDEEIFDIYRQTIFAEARTHGKAAEFINRATKNFPGLQKFLKSIYMRNSR